jgi:hypothetical protein
VEEKKIIRIKSRYGADLMGAQIFMDNKAWEVCALAKQEYRNGWLWQYWIVMPDKNIY